MFSGTLKLQDTTSLFGNGFVYIFLNAISLITCLEMWFKLLVTDYFYLKLVVKLSKLFLSYTVTIAVIVIFQVIYIVTVYS